MGPSPSDASSTVIFDQQQMPSGRRGRAIRVKIASTVTILAAKSFLRAGNLTIAPTLNVRQPIFCPNVWSDLTAHREA